MKIEDIKNANFIKNMNNEELMNLASDIRNFLIENISKTGGHLSSNLGIVDLTLSILKVFDYEKDIILFDVGHQAYTYKILTGRAKDFSSLRKNDTLCGFQSLKESKYDHYETGHSGTSISSGLGFALANQMDKKDSIVISIIGDGSFSNGLAYEALNHLGDTKCKQIVILNDNQMSISQNVGALHNFLDEIRGAKGYIDVKKGTKKTLKKTKIGSIIYKGLYNIKTSFKKIYLKKGSMFEDLGIDYYGPINGHDYKEMLKYLNIAKKLEGPVILHVITQKGKGYLPAENDTIGAFHGVGPFDIKSGEQIKKTNNPSYSEIISSYVYNYAKKDKDIICITPGMCYGSKLEVIKEKLPNQFIDVGIAEEHALVMANTLALSGKKPCVFIYSSFLQRAIDAIIHDIARCNSNVTIFVDRAGLVPSDGSSHQGIYDIPLLMSIPNVIISMPCDSKEANSLIYTSLNTKSPFVIRYPKDNLKYDYNNAENLPIGSWNVLKDGTDAIITTYGHFCQKALTIADSLAKVGISIKVVNARFIKPFDEKLFSSLLNDNIPIYVYEESSVIGSLGSILLAFKENIGKGAKIHLLGVKNAFQKTGSVDNLLKDNMLDEESVIKYIKKTLEK